MRSASAASPSHQQELLAIVSAWQNNAISRDTMFELFRRGEILPDGRTNDEEVRLLNSSTTHLRAGVAASRNADAARLND